jgi:hypothetical protein
MTGVRSQRSMKRASTPTTLLQRVTSLFKGGHNASLRCLFAPSPRLGGILSEIAIFHQRSLLSYGELMCDPWTDAEQYPLSHSYITLTKQHHFLNSGATSSASSGFKLVTSNDPCSRDTGKIAQTSVN